MGVALRKESVDRNRPQVSRLIIGFMSLSARRAWIEIDDMSGATGRILRVALRKESVDRNQFVHQSRLYYSDVALRKESVDRNMNPMISLDTCGRRSPQGERG